MAGNKQSQKKPDTPMQLCLFVAKTKVKRCKTMFLPTKDDPNPSVLPETFVFLTSVTTKPWAPYISLIERQPFVGNFYESMTS